MLLDVDGDPGIVMEYVASESRQRRIATAGPLPVEVAGLAVAAQSA